MPAAIILSVEKPVLIWAQSCNFSKAQHKTGSMKSMANNTKIQIISCNNIIIQKNPVWRLVMSVTDIYK